MRRTVDRSGHRTRGWSRDKGNSKSKESNGKSKGKKGKGKGKSKGKGKLNSVENWQDCWSETGAQGDEHAEGLLGVVSKLKDGGKRQMIRMDRVQGDVTPELSPVEPSPG